MNQPLLSSKSNENDNDDIIRPSYPLLLQYPEDTYTCEDSPSLSTPSITYYVPRFIPLHIHPYYFILSKTKSNLLSSDLIGYKIDDFVNEFAILFSDNNIEIKQRKNECSWEISTINSEPDDEDDEDDDKDEDYFDNFYNSDKYFHVLIKIYKFPETSIYSKQYCIEPHMYSRNNKSILWNYLIKNLRLLFIN